MFTELSEFAQQEGGLGLFWKQSAGLAPVDTQRVGVSLGGQLSTTAACSQPPGPGEEKGIVKAENFVLPPQGSQFQVKANCGLRSAAKGRKENTLATSIVAHRLAALDSSTNSVSSMSCGVAQFHSGHRSPLLASTLCTLHLPWFPFEHVPTCQKERAWKTSMFS